jgi:hypothetical protein
MIVGLRRTQVATGIPPIVRLAGSAMSIYTHVPEFAL